MDNDVYMQSLYRDAKEEKNYIEEQKMMDCSNAVDNDEAEMEAIRLAMIIDNYNKDHR